MQLYDYSMVEYHLLCSERLVKGFTSFWRNDCFCSCRSGTNLASCTTGQNYQCQDYNLLSCISSQCQCSSTMYWSNSSNYCMAKKSINGICASTNECLTAAGVGLSCMSGTCQCSSGYYWNPSPQQCDPVSG